MSSLAYSEIANCEFGPARGFRGLLYLSGSITGIEAQLATAHSIAAQSSMLTSLDYLQRS